MSFRKKILSLVLLSAPYLSDINATSYTWNNAARGDWSITTNWTPNGTPNGPSDSATFTGITSTKITQDISPVVQLSTMTFSFTDGPNPTLLQANASNRISLDTGISSSPAIVQVVSGKHSIEQTGGVGSLETVLVSGTSPVQFLIASGARLDITENVGTVTSNVPVSFSGPGTLGFLDTVANLGKEVITLDSGINMSFAYTDPANPGILGLLCSDPISSVMVQSGTLTLTNSVATAVDQPFQIDTPIFTLQNGDVNLVNNGQVSGGVEILSKVVFED